MEAPDRVGRHRPVAPVDQSGFEAERVELVLELLDPLFPSGERLRELVTVQRVQGGLVGDPVVGEAAGALESLDRIGGLWSVASVIGPGRKPQSGELALELLDSLDAPGERPVGRAGPQRRKRGGMGNTVGRQAADLLEAADGLGGLWPVAPVDEARVKPQPGQLALQRLDPLDPLLGWFWFINIQRSWPVDCAVLPCTCRRSSRRHRDRGLERGDLCRRAGGVLRGRRDGLRDRYRRSRDRGLTWLGDRGGLAVEGLVDLGCCGLLRWHAPSGPANAERGDRQRSDRQRARAAARSSTGSPRACGPPA